VALLDGTVLIDQFAADRINSDEVWNLIDRTTRRSTTRCPSSNA
jgi:hypothetical protein